jgi:hypothetical protein
MLSWSQVCIGRVVVGEVWVTSLYREESCRWRDVGHKFVSGELLLERCGIRSENLMIEDENLGKLEVRTS